MNKKIISIALITFGVILLAIVGYVSLSKSATVSTPTPTQTQMPLETTNPNKQSFQKADEVLDKTKSYTAILKTTDGDITIELFTDKTPITVNNFVFLAQKHFYDNTIFHRVIKGFMIQGGDPNGNGTGGPGYTFDDEPFTGEYKKGTVAMANAGPNTNGSQFFILQADYPLPKNYVIFGQVTKGIDVVDKIASEDVSVSPTGEMSKPVNPVKITSVEIEEK